jgi:hypothetical protein
LLTSIIPIASCSMKVSRSRLLLSLIAASSMYLFKR